MIDYYHNILEVINTKLHTLYKIKLELYYPLNETSHGTLFKFKTGY